MRFDHAVKYNGKVYYTGQDVPMKPEDELVALQRKAAELEKRPEKKINAALKSVPLHYANSNIPPVEITDTLLVEEKKATNDRIAELQSELNN